LDLSFEEERGVSLLYPSKPRSQKRYTVALDPPPGTGAAAAGLVTPPEPYQSAKKTKTSAVGQVPCNRLRSGPVVRHLPIIQAATMLIEAMSRFQLAAPAVNRRAHLHCCSHLMRRTLLRQTPPSWLSGRSRAHRRTVCRRLAPRIGLLPSLMRRHGLYGRPRLRPHLGNVLANAAE
jgi:hypothetical protein